MNVLKPKVLVRSMESRGMRHEVPYFSQYDESIPEEWRDRSCGITALRMALGAALPGQTLPSVTELIEEGIESGAYIEGVGWRHDGLVKLAKQYGANAYRGEYRIRGQSRLPQFLKAAYEHVLFLKGLSTVHNVVSRGGVPIVSVTVPGKRDTHLIPLVGYGEEGGQTGFYYHEPAAEVGSGGEYRFMSIAEFHVRWRRLAIYVEPVQAETKVQAPRANVAREPIPQMQFIWVRGGIFA